MTMICQSSQANSDLFLKKPTGFCPVGFPGVKNYLNALIIFSTSVFLPSLTRTM